MSGAAITTRAMVVGCARSGTTLVQTMLAAHPDVFSFPESHYFRKMWGRNWTRRAAGVVPPRAAARTLRDLVAELDLTGDPEIPRVSKWWPLAGRWGRAFAPTVDRAAARAGKRAWVEKTPTHLECLDLIEKWVPDPRVVHVVRDGREVVASLYELCHADPGRWVRNFLPAADRFTGVPADDTLIPAIVAHWNDAVRRTVRVAGRPRHHIVRYEALLTETDPTLEKLTAFLDLPPAPEMLRFWEAADQTVGWRQTMPHMQGAFEEGLREPASRFDESFPAEWRDRVESLLLDGGDLGQVF